ncbi:MAG: hypothetical protein HKN22_02045 [Bacteroidia bacterium]|nr:hypothetical protein [Bacteroidia bacterium]
MSKDNSFKKIEPTDSLPPEHKQEVLNTIELAKLMMNIADVFTVKRSKTDGEIANMLLKRKGK